MNILLQRDSAKYIYAVPEGLRELLSDITREVLRGRPKEIYTFIADYLDVLLITRENARVAAKVVENITQIGLIVAELLENTGMTRTEAGRISSIVEAAFKKFLSDGQTYKFEPGGRPPEEKDVVPSIMRKLSIPKKHRSVTSDIVERAFEVFKKSQEQGNDVLLGPVDWRIAANSTMRLYCKTNVTNEEVNKAASMIKAAYKGYYTRRTLKRLIEEGIKLTEEGEEECTCIPCEGQTSLKQADKQKIQKRKYIRFCDARAQTKKRSSSILKKTKTTVQVEKITQDEECVCEPICEVKSAEKKVGTQFIRRKSKIIQDEECVCEPICEVNAAEEKSGRPFVEGKENIIQDEECVCEPICEGKAEEEIARTSSFVQNRIKIIEEECVCEPICEVKESQNRIKFDESVSGSTTIPYYSSRASTQGEIHILRSPNSYLDTSDTDDITSSYGSETD